MWVCFKFCWALLETALLRYNLHRIKFPHLKHTACWQTHSYITTITFYHRQTLPWLRPIPTGLSAGSSLPSLPASPGQLLTCFLSLILLLLFLCFKDFIYLFLERGEGKEKERERNINVWLSLTRPPLGTWPTTQACALTGNWTRDPSVPRLTLNPLSYTIQSCWFCFF